MTKIAKYVCLECQGYTDNCKATCSKTQYYGVCVSFRPPKRGSQKWKLISKVIRTNAMPKYGEERKPEAPVWSRSFSRHREKSRSGFPKALRERSFLNARLEAKLPAGAEWQ